MSLKVVTVSEMALIEVMADATGVLYAEMMERAGQRTAEAIMARYAVQNAHVLVLVGPGNNGGDGLVAGRYLAQAGANVAFYLTRSRDPQHDANFAQVQAQNLFTVIAEFDQRFRVLRTRLATTDILIDAVFGTGVMRPITGELAKLFQAVKAGIAERDNERQKAALSPLVSLSQPLAPSTKLKVVAVDCPSGLHCDTGHLDPLALPADLTVTFAAAKRGHFLLPGGAACGELVVANIGIPSDLPELKSVHLEVVTAVTAQSLLPPRPPDGHKGTFGRALLVAGSENYWGAPFLAAKAAYRVGAGLVALAVPTAVRPTVAGQLPEATYPPVQTWDAVSGVGLRETAVTHQACLVGPGLGHAPEFLNAFLGTELPPLVIDADGLNFLAQWEDWPRRIPPNTILTPHPGEMARLIGTNDLSADRIALAQKKAAEWGHIVVLKGAFTVIAAPDGRTMLLPFANPLLSVAGSGDVLAGLIVGLLAQGVAPFEAAVLGGYLHGAAGQLAQAQFGTAGLLASELADWVTAVLRDLRSL